MTSEATAQPSEPLEIHQSTYDVFCMSNPLFGRFLKETGEIVIVDQKVTSHENAKRLSN